MIMEPLCCSSILLLTFLVIMVLKLILTIRPENTTGGAVLPPGPWQFPVIGSIHHMLRSTPHRSLRHLSTIYGPIIHLKLGEATAIVVSSTDAARAILMTHDIDFASRPLTVASKIMFQGGESLVFSPYGEQWRQLRKICALELLSARRVQSFRHIREKEVLELVRSVASSSSPSPAIVNLTQRLTSLVNDITARIVIGDKCKDQATFVSFITAALEAGVGLYLEDHFPSSSLARLAANGRNLRLERIRQRSDGILDQIVQEHKKWRAAAATAKGGESKEEEEEEEDLVDVLLRVQEEGDLHLTNTGIKAVIQDMFAAGTESSPTTVVWAMTELMRNPKVMVKAQSEVRGVMGVKGMLSEDEIGELNYLKLIIKGSMRLHPIIPLLQRLCRRSCRVLGYQIPEKARVMVNAWAMGRDPRYWGGDAEEFRPERFEESNIGFRGASFEYLPFGGGRRMCPGITFGLANVELMLAHLLCYFDWELPADVGPNGLDMSETSGVTARKKIDLCLRAIPMVPLPPITTTT